MALVSKSKKILEAKKSLILHIGSDRVIGALGIFSNNDRPHIVEIAEKEVRLGEQESELQFMKLFRDVTSKVAEILSRGGHFTPEHIYISLESPWFTGQTRTIYYSKKTPFIFTENISHSLIDQDFKQYKTEAEEAFGEKLQMLDKSVIVTKLNGFQVSSPIGKKAREVSISYYASLSPKLFLDNLCEDLEKVLRGKIRFFSSSASLAGALYMTLERYKKLLVVSIGGEVTEVLYLENGILINNSTFPSGRNFLLKTLGNELKQNPLEIFSLLNLCSAGRAHENVTRKVDQIVGVVEKVWRKQLRKSVHDVIGPVHSDIPVMTVGSQDTLSLFKNMVNNEHLTRGAQETAISSKEWGNIIASDFFKHQGGNSTIPPLLLADCLYIYGINV
ncbi:MAG: hypothetical protein RL641_71 [Candidatus Parcubacteria bacterium]|jgi:hypothetical protein